MGIIGIVGGVGPYAGLDIKKKIFDEVDANCDQDYPEVYLVSRSSNIVDRTAYIIGKSDDSPAFEISQSIKKLHTIDANIICIPCNTAHSPVILNEVLDIIKDEGIEIDFVNIIEECIKYISENIGQGSNAMLLGTLGTYNSKVYSIYAQRMNNSVNILVPSEADKSKINSAIYDKNYGIKAKSNPVTQKAIDDIVEVSKRAINTGSDCVIAGCTELPIALEGVTLNKPIIDPTSILAKAVLEKVYNS